MSEIKVKIPTQRNAVKVKVQQANTGQLISSAPVVVTSIPQPPTRRLDALADVDARAEIEGGVPVYHSSNDTYTVEKLDFEMLGDIPGLDAIDGGTY